MNLIQELALNFYGIHPHCGDYEFLAIQLRDVRKVNQRPPGSGRSRRIDPYRQPDRYQGGKEVHYHHQIKN